MLLMNGLSNKDSTAQSRQECFSEQVLMNGGKSPIFGNF
jgi:hypothetical protein